MTRTNTKPIIALNAVSARTPILQSVLDALNEGRISEAVDQFDDDFTFTDHALDLEFTTKERLIEFFQKSRELFPDTVVKVDSILQCGDHAVAEWKLTATQTVPGSGPTHFRFPISLRGTSIVRTENGRITFWSTQTDRGGSVWLHFSQSGSSLNPLLCVHERRRKSNG